MGRGFSSAFWSKARWCGPVGAIVLGGAAVFPARADEAPALSTLSGKLDQGALQEAFHLLRRNYIQRETLDLVALNRSALTGVLERLDFGAELLPAAAGRPEADAGPQPRFFNRHEMVADRIGYLRPEPTAGALDALDASLKELVTAGALTLVLDLRMPGPHGEFSAAAAILERFLPPGEPFFTVQRIDDPHPTVFRGARPPLFSGKIVLLIDGETNNVGETVALALAARLGCFTVGEPTRGRTMAYHTAPLSPDVVLRYASAEMKLSDGISHFRKGMEPRLRVPFPADRKRTVFLGSQSAAGVKPFLHDSERPRVNEHALVTRGLPELPYQLEKSAGKISDFDTVPLQDPVLRAAVDVLVSEAVFSHGKGVR